MSLEPRISIGVLDDLVWDLLDVSLHFWVGVFTADETLRGEQGILGVDDCLALCRNAN